jgi:hypothetical protein
MGHAGTAMSRFTPKTAALPRFADRSGTMTYVEIGVGQLARVAALQEILHVLRGDVAGEACDHWLGALLRGMELVAVAVDEEPPGYSKSALIVAGAVRPSWKS